MSTLFLLQSLLWFWYIDPPCFCYYGNQIHFRISPWIWLTDGLSFLGHRTSHYLQGHLSKQLRVWILEPTDWVQIPALLLNLMTWVGWPLSWFARDWEVSQDMGLSALKLRKSSLVQTGYPRPGASYSTFLHFSFLICQVGNLGIVTDSMDSGVGGSREADSTWNCVGSSVSKHQWVSCHFFFWSGLLTLHMGIVELMWCNDTTRPEPRPWTWLWTL